MKLIHKAKLVKSITQDYNVPLCGVKWKPQMKMAYRWEGVTCKRCLKSLGE